MKLMIASDLHGSAGYCRAMLEALKREGSERLLLLGDLLYHGPRNDLPRDYAPKEVIALLNGVKNQLLCVRGNCEAEVDQMVLDFPVMAEYCVIFWGWTDGLCYPRPPVPSGGTCRRCSAATSWYMATPMFRGGSSLGGTTYI